MKIREAVAWVLVVALFYTTAWQHDRSHRNWQEKEQWKSLYFHVLPFLRSEIAVDPIYIPSRNDYVCAPGWIPAGGWGPNGVPLHEPIGCKREEQTK
jgi:hypothetical protein